MVVVLLARGCCQRVCLSAGTPRSHAPYGDAAGAARTAPAVLRCALQGMQAAALLWPGQPAAEAHSPHGRSPCLVVSQQLTSLQRSMMPSQPCTARGQPRAAVGQSRVCAQVWPCAVHTSSTHRPLTGHTQATHRPDALVHTSQHKACM